MEGGGKGGFKVFLLSVGTEVGVRREVRGFLDIVWVWWVGLEIYFRVMLI